MEVRVLPDNHFGLIHGKAGVITLADGSKTTFLGRQVNESMSAWTLNYELLWEDPSTEAITWVHEEFDALWTITLPSHLLNSLSRTSTVSADARSSPRLRIGKRKTMNSHPRHRPRRSSLNLRYTGVMPGSGRTRSTSSNLPSTPDSSATGGARFVLADQVGLGKTIQLAMAAELMALTGEKPVLVLLPRPCCGNGRMS